MRAPLTLPPEKETDDCARVAAALEQVDRHCNVDFASRRDCDRSLGVTASVAKRVIARRNGRLLVLTVERKKVIAPKVQILVFQHRWPFYAARSVRRKRGRTAPPRFALEGVFRAPPHRAPNHSLALTIVERDRLTPSL